MIERIIDVTRKSVERRMKIKPVQELRASALKTTRSLAQTLTHRRSAMILECKKASPSQGVIRPHFDVAEIVKAYDPFADAVSVLTNAEFFEGNHNFLQKAREHTNKPLLCKDFIISPYQVYEARVNDADSVLLMMSLLDDNAFKENFEVARSLNMDVLVEVHDENELDRALRHGAHIIGVNSRDFKTLKVDLTTSERLLPLVPKDKIAIFESGISNHHQVLDYRNIAAGFLVGTSLMRQHNLPRAVRELVFGRVKVCGLTRAQDVREAERYGATFGGLILTSESPRCVTLEQATSVREGSSLSFVGVFVNQSPEFITDSAKRLNLSAVQLHGDENTRYVRELRLLLPSDVEIWKAIRVNETIDSPERYGCDRILLDAYSKDKRGGTGKRFDWGKLKDLNRDRYILSGGLSPENAREADEQRLWALDVNSGVEVAPGIKDEKRVRAFFEELR